MRERTVVMGALIGWWLGRSKRAALITGLAGVVFALGPGHNTAFVTLVPGVAGLALKMLALMAVIVFVAAVVLVYGQELLLRHNENANRMDVFKKLGVLNNDRV
jgi:hypothetical protein